LNPLPPALGGASTVCGWRLDRKVHAPTWDQGIGAFKGGGRWNSIGNATVYASLDPSTSILEVAVHKGFDVLDVDPHILIGFQVLDPADVHVVQPSAVPNPNWLRPGKPSKGQQQFGDHLLSTHKFIVIPSAVTASTWNLLFSPAMAGTAFTQFYFEPFALDTRLNPPAPAPTPAP
jgi:RES domain-containing protein